MPDREENEFPSEDRRRSPQLTTWRLGRLEDEMKTKAAKEEVQRVENDVKEDFGRLLNEVDGMKKAMWAVAGSWLVGSGMFLLAVLEFAR